MEKSNNQQRREIETRERKGREIDGVCLRQFEETEKNKETLENTKEERLSMGQRDQR